MCMQFIDTPSAFEAILWGFVRRGARISDVRLSGFAHVLYLFTGGISDVTCLGRGGVLSISAGEPPRDGPVRKEYVSNGHQR
jgi:hypothetical protein